MPSADRSTTRPWPICTRTADVASAQAAIDTAKIDLDYTRVVSPIRGRISFSQTTEGAYVQASAATLMGWCSRPTRSTSTSRARRSSCCGSVHLAVDEGQLKLDDGRVKVQLLLDDGSDYAQEGVFQTMDVAVNETTASPVLACDLPDPKGMLRAPVSSSGRAWSMAARSRVVRLRRHP